MASKELRVQISGDSGDLERALRRSNKGLDSLGKQTRLTSSVSSKGFAAMKVGATGAAAGIVGLALAGKRVVGAAIESEKAEAKLAAQLKASGISYRAHAAEIDAVIQKHSQLAGVDDEELSDAFTTLVRSTGSVEVAMRDLGVVTDFARAKNVTVAQAATAVAKVHAGAVTPLKALGIEFVKTTANVDKLRASNEKATPAQLAAAKAADKAANSTRAIGLLQDKVKGQAKAYGETTAGAMDRAKVASENLQETIGGALAPAVEKAANAGAKFVNEMQSGEGAGGRFAAKMKDIAEEVKPIAVGLFRAGKAVVGFVAANPGLVKVAAAVAGVAVAVKVVTMAIKAWAVVTRVATTTFWALNAAMVANPVGLIVVGVAALTAGLVIAYKRSETFRKVIDGVFTALKVGIGYAIMPLIKSLDLLAGGFSMILRGIGKLPKMSWATKAADAIDNAREKVRGFAKSLRDIPDKKAVKVAVAVTYKNADGKVRRSSASIGDGIGRFAAANAPMLSAGAIGSGSIGGGSSAVPLLGANAALSPYASFGAGYGLRVSSGKRATGGRTSSGGVSYHGSGEAVDLAGTPKGMLAFARAVSRKAGGKLAELIHTPLGSGQVKDGRSYVYGGTVAAQHNDHVHIAVDLGKPGPGIGDGDGRRAPFTGDGLGKSALMNLWTREGGSPKAANLAAAVALAESGGDSKVSNKNTDGSVDRGLWQINSVHGALSTFDKAGNAQAAIKISGGGRNWKPWVAFTNGSYRKFLAGGQLNASTRRAVAGDAREGQERAGSRAVNRLVERFGGDRDARLSQTPGQRVRMIPGSTGFGTLTRRARELGGRIEDADGAYGRLERRQGQSDEDLGTPQGRAKRGQELADLRAEKRKQLARERKRAAVLRGAIRKLEGLLKAGAKLRDKSKGAKRAKIVARLKTYGDRLTDLRVELKALGGQIADTELDIGDLDKDAADVAGTPDGGDAPDAPETPLEAAASAVSLIDLRERAGEITPAQARNERIRAIREALASPGLSQRDRLQLQGDLIEAQQAVVAAVEDNTSAIRDLRDQMAASLAFAQSVTATENYSLTKSIADIIGGQIVGFGVAPLGMTAGSGARTNGF